MLQGLLMKAEAYYQMMQFEYALMFYHRGNKIRPEVQAFRLGIQKSREAIENSIGGKTLNDIVHDARTWIFKAIFQPSLGHPIAC